MAAFINSGYRGDQRVAWTAVSQSVGLQAVAGIRRAAPSRERLQLRRSSHEDALIAPILFVTGFSSMALEVIWTRAFTPVLGTYVYSFAGLLFVYLWATWVGSWIYTGATWLARAALHPHQSSWRCSRSRACCPSSLNDARVAGIEIRWRLAASSRSARLLGYLTPSLIDRYSQDEPRLAPDRAYAINVIGCVLGPLVAGYVLLPTLGARFGARRACAPFPVLFGSALAVVRP